MTSSPAFSTLAEPFLVPSDIKVWSVLVTIIGDLAPDAAIGGPILTSLIEAMGLQSQAMRVALHRLKRDGWVESEKVGRVGYYRMSKSAKSSTYSVGSRVYAESVARITSLQLLVGNPIDPEPFDFGFQIAPNVCLAKEGQGLEGQLAVSVRADLLPEWVMAKVREGACFNDCERLAVDLERLLSLLDSDALNVIQKTALRILVLHRWRRLALRMEALAEATLGAAEAPAVCRARVAKCLEMLPRPSLDELGQASGLI